VIGGNKKAKFIGLGFKEKSITWEANSIENAYENHLRKLSIQYNNDGTDIPNSYFESFAAN